MKPFQLDLFNDIQPEPVPAAAPAAPVLNGYYYERSTDKYVSFAMGVRYFEEPAKGCSYPKEWQERIKRERAI